VVSRRAFRRLAVATLLLLAIPVAAPAAPQQRLSPCAVVHPSDAKVTWSCRRLKRGETLRSVFGDRWIDGARFNRIDRRHTGAGTELKVPARLDDIADFTAMPRTYADAERIPRLIVIDLAEQFLGAYEHGRLVFSGPVTTGYEGQETPAGEFTITATDPARRSSLYTIEGTTTPYPMNSALRFHVDADGVAYWIHGRDLPGYPASHGCIGLYDERMQKETYGRPADPLLDDARVLYRWVVGARPDDTGVRGLTDGPSVRIIGRAPGRSRVRSAAAQEHLAAGRDLPVQPGVESRGVGSTGSGCGR
jgi:lipoprotein-anchoring transpeptidase ErfK/SrfK